MVLPSMFVLGEPDIRSAVKKSPNIGSAISTSPATIPGIEGLADAKPWTNREGTLHKEVPASLLVLGGGPVGSELAQAWRSLGSEVTLIEGERRLLPREEEYACVQLTEALEEYGVDIRTGQLAAKVEQRGETVVVVGHQPECGLVAAALGGGPEPRFPPAGTALVELPG